MSVRMPTVLGETIEQTPNHHEEDFVHVNKYCAQLRQEFCCLQAKYLKSLEARMAGLSAANPILLDVPDYDGFRRELKSKSGLLAVDFFTLLSDKEYADIIIKCGDVKIPGHKAILCARSEWFADSYKEAKAAGTDVIEIVCDDSRIVRSLLKWLYTGHVSLNDSDIGEYAAAPIHWILYAIKLFILANKLNLTDLCEQLHTALFWRLDFAKLKPADEKPVLEAIELVYTSIVEPMHCHERHIRPMIVLKIVRASDSILTTLPKITDLIRKIPDLGVEWTARQIDYEKEHTVTCLQCGIKFSMRNVRGQLKPEPAKDPAEDETWDEFEMDPYVMTRIAWCVGCGFKHDLDEWLGY